MKTQGEHIRTLRRRVDFLKTRDYKNSYDQAELGALEWALVNLPPQQGPDVDRLVELARADEREACAKVCDQMAQRTQDIRSAALESAAENIRARSDT